MGADVAIVGMACTFAQARNSEEFWRNIVNKVDAVTDVSPARIESDDFFDPANEERIYCKKGGWLGASFMFNPLQFGVMPAALEGAEPDHFLVLRTVREALEDARYKENEIDGQRVSVILGKGNYLGPGVAALIFRGVVTQQVLTIIRGLHPDLTAEQLGSIKSRLRSSLPRFSAEVASGLIPNITTGRVANRLDFMGPNFTIDAACASSLIATEVALQDLVSRKYDLVLAGGVHIFSSIPFLQVFGAMKALSHSSTIQPFDEHCDGTIPGEGIGLLVLRRLADAERDGDRIYAVIKGAGTSSDGRAKSVTAPRREGEELALRRAYEMSGVSPQSVELIEGHGTGTAAGDAVEVDALGRVFGPSEHGRPTCALGSVKSMIGHAMPAAGAAGLIKAALSLYHGVLPPTLHCNQPRSPLQEPESRFYINTETRPWIRRSDGEPRRAGVNAFGFGGINAHVVLEEYRGNPPERHTLLRDWECELVLLEAENRAALIKAAEDLRRYAENAEGVALRDIAHTLNTPAQGPAERVAVIATSLPDLARKLARVKERLSDPQCKQIKDRQGLYYFGDPDLRHGKVALLFPGEGSQYLNMLSDLCIHFPEVRSAFDRADSTVKDPGRWPLSAIVYPPPAFSDDAAAASQTRLWSIERATEAVLTADGAMFQLLRKLGVKPDMMTGHSAGEWVGLAAAGVVEIDALVDSMDRLSGMYRRLAEDSTVPSMALLAVGAPRARVEQLVSEIECEVHVANDNCPHQIVIAAKPDDAERVTAHLQKNGTFVEKLPYDRGYHTPAFTYIRSPLRECFSAMEVHSPEVPLYSCTTASLYPADAAGILEIVSNTFTRPILFVRTIDAMYEAGARIFVEAGPRGNLTAFVDDILRGRPHLGVAIDQFRRPGLESLHHALGMLAAAGVPLQLDPLYARRLPRKLSCNIEADRVIGEDQAPGVVRVSTCYPRLQTPPPLERPSSVHAPLNGDTPFAVPSLAAAPPEKVNGRANRAVPAPGILSDHFTLMEQFLETEEAVMLSLLGGRAPASPEASHAAVEVQTAVLDPPPRELKEPESGPSLAQLLLATVSEKTGYPVETLGLDLDMEADLGIDSIKRVEILGALRVTESALPADAAMEEVARLKTLRQVLAFLEKLSGAQSAPSNGPSSPRRGPLIRSGVVVSEVAGASISIQCTIDPAEHRYLYDHCLYFRGSDEPSHGVPLMSVPLTCSVEWMAEAAALLCPDLRMIGARDIQAVRRINITPEGAPVALLITATRAQANAVRVTMRSEGSPEDDEPVKADLLAQATVLFASDFPQSPAPGDPHLKNIRTPSRSAKEIYTDHCMFHGPTFHGVASLDAIAENGIRGRLEALSPHGVLTSVDAPDFLIDPFLLDAAGQLVGYWPIEYLEEGFVVLPIRISEFSLFRENLLPGEKAECRVQIKAVTHRQVKADFDVIAPGGELWMRVSGWEDWRFFWARRLYDFWRFPNQCANGVRVEIPALERTGAECRMLDLMDGADTTGLWEDLCVHMILSESELKEHHATIDADARKRSILLRAAAKDAARMWLQRQYGRNLYPTEVQLAGDGDGRFHADGGWSSELGRPRVSAACCGEVAVAVASEHQVGVAIETAGRDTDEQAVREHCAAQAAAHLLGGNAADHAATVETVREKDHIIAVAWI